MGVIVGFDYQAFLRSYPEMSALGEPRAQEYFDIATAIHANDGGGPISSASLQQSLLNMLTAHVAFLFAPRGPDGNPAQTGQAAPAMVGRITSASQGSVSVSAEALQGFNTAQASWLAQSRYGAMYWASTAQFRTFRFRSRPRFRGGSIVTPINFPGR